MTAKKGKGGKKKQKAPGAAAKGPAAAAGASSDGGAPSGAAGGDGLAPSAGQNGPLSPVAAGGDGEPDLESGLPLIFNSLNGLNGASSGLGGGEHGTEEDGAQPPLILINSAALYQGMPGGGNDCGHNAEPLSASETVISAARRRWPWLDLPPKELKALLADLRGAAAASSGGGGSGGTSSGAVELRVQAGKVKESLDSIRCMICRVRMQDAFERFIGASVVVSGGSGGTSSGGGGSAFALGSGMQLSLQAEAAAAAGAPGSLEAAAAAAAGAAAVGEEALSSRPPKQQGQKGVPLSVVGELTQAQLAQLVASVRTAAQFAPGDDAEDAAADTEGGGGSSTAAAAPAAGAAGAAARIGTLRRLGSGSGGARDRVRGMASAAIVAADAGAASGRDDGVITGLSWRECVHGFVPPSGMDDDDADEAAAAMAAAMSAGVGDGHLFFTGPGAARLRREPSSHHLLHFAQNAETQRTNVTSICAQLRNCLDGGDNGEHDPHVLEGWNPKFSQVHQSAEQAIQAWLKCLTLALQQLACLQTFAFLSAESGDELTARHLSNSLWDALEAATSAVLEAALAARREQVKDTPQVGVMAAALCFAAGAPHRQALARAVRAKRQAVEKLHKIVAAALAPQATQELITRLTGLQQKWERLLLGPDDFLGQVDAVAQRVNLLRLAVANNAEPGFPVFVQKNDPLGVEQTHDGQLKRAVQEFENTLDLFKEGALERVRADLSPATYPQSPALTKALAVWQEEFFKKQWEEHEEGQQLQAKLSQQEVQKLTNDMHVQRQTHKTLKDTQDQRRKQLEKRMKKEANEAANEEYGAVFAAALAATEAPREEKLEIEVNRAHTTMMLTQQRQIQTCLTFRVFAARQLFRRYRLLREFFAQMQCRIVCKDRLVERLCGSDEHASRRLQVVTAVTALEIVSSFCQDWVAGRVERKLVEDEEREIARNRQRAEKRRRGNRAATPVSAAVPAAEEGATEEEAGSSSPRREPRPAQAAEKGGAAASASEGGGSSGLRTGFAAAEFAVSEQFLSDQFSAEYLAGGGEENAEASDGFVTIKPRRGKGKGRAAKGSGDDATAATTEEEEAAEGGGGAGGGSGEAGSLEAAIQAIDAAGAEASGSGWGEPPPADVEEIGSGWGEPVGAAAAAPASLRGAGRPRRLRGPAPPPQGRGGAGHGAARDTSGGSRRRGGGSGGNALMSPRGQHQQHRREPPPPPYAAVAAASGAGEEQEFLGALEASSSAVAAAAAAASPSSLASSQAASPRAPLDLISSEDMASVSVPGRAAAIEHQPPPPTPATREIPGADAAVQIRHEQQGTASAGRSGASFGASVGASSGPAYASRMSAAARVFEPESILQQQRRGGGLVNPATARSVVPPRQAAAAAAAVAGGDYSADVAAAAASGMTFVPYGAMPAAVIGPPQPLAPLADAAPPPELNGRAAPPAPPPELNGRPPQLQQQLSLPPPPPAAAGGRVYIAPEDEVPEPAESIDGSSSGVGGSGYDGYEEEIGDAPDVEGAVAPGAAAPSTKVKPTAAGGDDDGGDGLLFSFGTVDVSEPTDAVDSFAISFGTVEEEQPAAAAAAEAELELAAQRQAPQFPSASPAPLQGELADGSNDDAGSVGRIAESVLYSPARGVAGAGGFGGGGSGRLGQETTAAVTPSVPAVPETEQGSGPVSAATSLSPRRRNSGTAFDSPAARSGGGGGGGAGGGGHLHPHSHAREHFPHHGGVGAFGPGGSPSQQMLAAAAALQNPRFSQGRNNRQLYRSGPPPPQPQHQQQHGVGGNSPLHFSPGQQGRSMRSGGPSPVPLYSSVPGGGGNGPMHMQAQGVLYGNGMGPAPPMQAFQGHQQHPQQQQHGAPAMMANRHHVGPPGGGMPGAMDAQGFNGAVGGGAGGLRYFVPVVAGGSGSHGGVPGQHGGGGSGGPLAGMAGFQVQQQGAPVPFRQQPQQQQQHLQQHNGQMGGGGGMATQQGVPEPTSPTRMGQQQQMQIQGFAPNGGGQQANGYRGSPMAFSLPPQYGYMVAAPPTEGVHVQGAQQQMLYGAAPSHALQPQGYAGAGAGGPPLSPYRGAMQPPPHLHFEGGQQMPPPQQQQQQQQQQLQGGRVPPPFMGGMAMGQQQQPPQHPPGSPGQQQHGMAVHQGGHSPLRGSFQMDPGGAYGPQGSVLRGGAKKKPRGGLLAAGAGTAGFVGGSPIRGGGGMAGENGLAGGSPGGSGNVSGGNFSGVAGAYYDPLRARNGKKDKRKSPVPLPGQQGFGQSMAYGGEAGAPFPQQQQQQQQQQQHGHAQGDGALGGAAGFAGGFVPQHQLQQQQMAGHYLPQGQGQGPSHQPQQQQHHHAGYGMAQQQQMQFGHHEHQMTSQMPPPQQQQFVPPQQQYAHQQPHQQPQQQQPLPQPQHQQQHYGQEQQRRPLSPQRQQQQHQQQLEGPQAYEAEHLPAYGAETATFGADVPSPGQQQQHQQQLLQQEHEEQHSPALEYPAPTFAAEQQQQQQQPQQPQHGPAQMHYVMAQQPPLELPQEVDGTRELSPPPYTLSPAPTPTFTPSPQPQQQQQQQPPQQPVQQQRQEDAAPRPPAMQPPPPQQQRAAASGSPTKQVAAVLPSPRQQQAPLQQAAQQPSAQGASVVAAPLPAAAPQGQRAAADAAAAAATAGLPPVAAAGHRPTPLEEQQVPGLADGSGAATVPSRRRSPSPLPPAPLSPPPLPTEIGRAMALPRGLRNAIGQNNCFLNVVVQSLWHLDSFRERFRASGRRPDSAAAAAAPADAAAGSRGGGGGSGGAIWGRMGKEKEGNRRLEGALRTVFRGLSEVLPVSESPGCARGRRQLGGGGGATSGDAAAGEGGSSSDGAADSQPEDVSVEELRKALSELSSHDERFGVGRMDDAAEALEMMLGCLSEVIEGGVVPQVFCMHVREVLRCPRCGVSSPTPPHDYDTNVFYVPVKAVREARRRDTSLPFDALLRLAGRGDVMSCQNREGCALARRGERMPSERFLLGEAPAVFSLGLVIETLKFSADFVADLLSIMGPSVDLSVVFSQEGPSRPARLRGLFCFQAQRHHYVAFFYNRAVRQWLLLDDADITPIGPDFKSVIDRCVSDSYHPSLVFYERPMQLPLTGEQAAGDATAA